MNGGVVGKVTPISIENGSVTLPLVGGDQGKRYLVVLGSIVPRGQGSTVVVRQSASNSTMVTEPIPVLGPTPRPTWWTWRVENDRRQMERVRRANSADAPYVAARIASSRTFHLFVGEDDLYDTKKYIPVTAKLARTGKWCLVYADSDDRVSAELLDDVVRTFDERVYPAARQRFGQHRDVDRNGKFTILISGWLDRLSSGKVSLSGFVRGADFYRDVSAPFSNQCDMLYLNASLVPGEHLRTVLAHEYTHAITFSEHTFTEYLPGGHGQDEEAWLGEALAHLAENYHGEGWSNLDYRISTYLSDPGAYRLVVPDYYQDGLWRSHGCRGATYLFLRYLVDRFGVELLTELSRSNLEGIANIETATQTPFADLFRQWSVHLAGGGTLGNRSEVGGGEIPLVGRLGERLLAGPRPVELEQEETEVSLAPTSWSSLLVTVDAGAGKKIDISGDPSADLQVTLIELPSDRARVKMQVAALPGSTDRVRLGLQADRVVAWRSLSWERAKLRQERARSNEKLARIVLAEDVLAADPGDGRLTDSDRTFMTVSDLIDLREFEGDRVVFKAVGVDQEGRLVTAWGTYEPSELLNASAEGTRRDLLAR